MVDGEDTPQDEPKAEAVADAPAGTPKVNWNDSDMGTTHANVVNAVASREEVALFFGTNRTWNPGDGKPLEVDLAQRVVLNPHAAKRLLTLLAAVLAQYEKRHGKIDITPGGAIGGSDPSVN